ncbi:MAG: 3-hydroxyacyl-CoA dehydrogenase NAD-binding domain-containing protein [Candidatus Omnitrophota bacterium]|nr:3-hydroxyacyl-CoA dehydrogenase NAD-binding domain-containing protein [Candidatus Omnitrophota bacterium]
MQNNLKLKIENGFAIIEFDQPDSKVNVLSSSSLKELEAVIAQLKNRQDLKGLLISSAKPDIFIAGADIREIEKMASGSDAEALVKKGQKILNALEELGLPTAALINGVCLGGGLELALACDYRLAGYSSKVKLGLPEVKLGIIPGFGGTKRLARLVGLQKALSMILSGDPVSSSEALKIGLVDKLASQDRLLEEGISMISEKKIKRNKFKPKLKGWVSILLDRTFLGRMILINGTRKFVLKTTKGQYPAPLKALEVVSKNYTSSLEKSLDREAKAFGELGVTQISKNLISVFYLIEKYKKVVWSDVAPVKIGKCGLLGAGVMGGGIAQLLSFCGIPVRMRDLNYQALGRGLKQAKEVYDYAVKKKKIKPSQAAMGMGLISPTTGYQGFLGADLIIEAVMEDMAIKKAVFKELDSLARPGAVLASNTSCLSVSQMSEGVKDKSRVLGIHFFNPVHRMPLIEIIRTPQTSGAAIATVVEFTRRVGKIPIVVSDTCGFLINRVLLSYLNEAARMLEEGLSIEKVDSVMLRFGMPMGPFTLMDEVGLDVGYKVALILENNFGEKMKVAGIMKKVYEKKWFGKKSGIGFYLHKGKNRVVNKEVYGLLSGVSASGVSEEEIMERMVYRMINEAALCLQEKVCSEPSDVDIGMIMGTGFPAFRAGLLRYADSVGCDKIADTMQRFREKYKSERFLPCSYLLDLAKRNGRFYR